MEFATRCSWCEVERCSRLTSCYACHAGGQHGVLKINIFACGCRCVSLGISQAPLTFPPPYVQPNVSSQWLNWVVCGQVRVCSNCIPRTQDWDNKKDKHHGVIIRSLPHLTIAVKRKTGAARSSPVGGYFLTRYVRRQQRCGSLQRHARRAKADISSGRLGGLV